MYLRFLRGGAEPEMVRLSGRPELLTRGLGVPGSGAIGRMWVPGERTKGAVLGARRGLYGRAGAVEDGRRQPGRVVAEQRNSGAFIRVWEEQRRSVWARFAMGNPRCLLQRTLRLQVAGCASPRRVRLLSAPANQGVEVQKACPVAFRWRSEGEKKSVWRAE